MAKRKTTAERISKFTAKTEYRNLNITKATSINPNELKTNEMRDYYNSLIKIANKRIKNLKDAGLGRLSPALGQRKGRYFKPIKTPKINRNLDTYRNRMYHEVMKIQNFLDAKTSTLRGTKKFMSDVMNTIRKQTGLKKLKFNKSEFKRFFKLWDKAVERWGGGDVKGKKNDSPVWKKLAELVHSRDWNKESDILDAMEEEFKLQYEESEEIESATVTDILSV